jgi:hypothetical protein
MAGRAGVEDGGRVGRRGVYEGGRWWGLRETRGSSANRKMI